MLELTSNGIVDGDREHTLLEIHRLTTQSARDLRNLRRIASRYYVDVEPTEARIIDTTLDWIRGTMLGNNTCKS